MNKEQQREALEWLVNDTDPANYIVVDFEGGKYKKPTYCGTLRIDLHEVFTWRRGLSTFPNRVNASEVKFVQELNRLTSTGRILVCYSTYDVDIFVKHFPGLRCEIKNVKPIFEYVWEELNPGTKANKTLNSLYYQVCSKTIKHKGDIGPRVKAMFDQLKICKYKYEPMDPEHKQTWEDYIEYNRADCQAVVDIIEELKRRLKAANISPK